MAIEETVVWDRLVTVIRRTFDDESLVVTQETTARHVDGWDSVANVELMVSLEMEFGVRFYTGQIAKVKNVGELRDAILPLVNR